MKQNKEFQHISSLSELHKLLKVDKPKYPTISLIPFQSIDWSFIFHQITYIWDFYMISIKYGADPFIYGRNYYDFEEGTLVFTAPGQAITLIGDGADVGKIKGWTLFFHADLIRNTNLGTKINHYTFFSYDLSEGLHISADEEQKISAIVREIEKEYSQSIDKHSHSLIISNLELLLNNCLRFYDRQFYTRSNQQKDIIMKIETYLKNYFDSEDSLKNGLPTVGQCAQRVSLSANYLSDLLKKETGKSTQDHIHYYLIEKAKTLLLSTDNSMSEIAYQLGFEYPQYFGNLFKKKTGMSPKKYKEGYHTK